MEQTGSQPTYCLQKKKLVESLNFYVDKLIYAQFFCVYMWIKAPEILKEKGKMRLLTIFISFFNNYFFNVFTNNKIYWKWFY